MAERSRTISLSARPDTYADTDKLAEKAELRKNQRAAVGLAVIGISSEVVVDPVGDIPENIILAEE